MATREAAEVSAQPDASGDGAESRSASAPMAEREAHEGSPERAGIATHLAIARSVYGLVIVMSVLEVMEIHPPHAGWAGPELLVGTVLTVALAEVDADAIAGMFVHHKRLSRSEAGHIGWEAVPLLVGAPLPVAVLVLSALGLVEIHHAIDGAQIVAYTTLLLFGWWMARNLGTRPAARVAGGVTLVAIAFLLVALKAAFHEPARSRRARSIA
jgi:hypothetical protein